jgi:hypothetical protein
LRAAYAEFGRWLNEQLETETAALAYAVIGLQRQTMGAMLGHALDHQAWGDAIGIVQALNPYWRIRGLNGEADAWADSLGITASLDHDSAEPAT